VHRDDEAGQLAALRGMGEGASRATGSRKARISGTIGTCTGSRRLPVAGQRGGPGLMLRRLVLAVAVLSLVAIGAACTSSKPKASGSPTPTMSTSSTPTKSSASPSPSSTRTTDPQAQPAVTAYTKFMAAAAHAQMKPPSVGAGYPANADITKYTFDPLQHQYNIYISGLASQGVAFRGAPPTPRITITAINLAAKPYPTVVLMDCPTPAPTWKAYDSSGKVVPDKPGTVPPPHKTTIQMINYQGHWGVYKSTPDASKTCSA
jgi:hypothetical protein